MNSHLRLFAVLFFLGAFLPGCSKSANTSAPPVSFTQADADKAIAQVQNLPEPQRSGAIKAIQDKLKEAQSQPPK